MMADDLGLLDACDPDALLAPLLALIEALHLQEKTPIELSLLVQLLEKWYYYPSLAALLVRAINTFLQHHPDHEPFSHAFLELMLHVAFDMHDPDATEQSLLWAVAVAGQDPTPLLLNGTLLFFLRQYHGSGHISLRRRTLQLAKVMLQVSGRIPDNVAALLACADAVGLYLDDADKIVSDSAFEWTTTVARRFVRLKPAYATLWLHRTAVQAYWLTHFARASAADKLSLLECLCPMAPHGLHPRWVPLVEENFNQEGSNHRFCQGSIQLLAAIASVGCVASVSSPVEPTTSGWSCSVCTFENPPEASTLCLVCDARRFETSLLLAWQDEWATRQVDFASAPEDVVCLAPVELTRFVDPLHAFLRFEAMADVLDAGVRLLLRILDKSSRRHLGLAAACLGVLASACPNTNMDAILDTFHLSDETNDECRDLLVQYCVVGPDTCDVAEGAHTVEQPQTLVQGNGLPLVNQKDLQNSDALVPHRRDALDFQFIHDKPTHHIDPNHFLRCRFHVTASDVVDALVHPLLSFGYVVSTITTIEPRTLADAVDFEAQLELALTVACQSDDRADDHHESPSGLLTWHTKLGTTLHPSDVVASAVQGSLNLVHVYHMSALALVPPPASSLSLDGVEHVSTSLPRFSHCVAREMQVPWRQMTKTMPLRYMPLLVVQPLVVPLCLRASFVLGSASARTLREASGGRSTIEVSRAALLASAVLATPPQRVVYVTFEGEKGHGVGPTTEFYSDLGRMFGHRQFGLWREDEDHGGSDAFVSTPNGWFPAARATTRRHLDQFNLFGRFLARACLDGYAIHVPLSLAFVQALQGKCLTWLDFATVDPQLAHAIDRLSHESAAAIASMELTFTVPGCDDHLLCEGGDAMPVTAATVAEYIALVKKALLETYLEPQVHAVRTGFGQLLNPVVLEMFTPHELQDLWYPHDQDEWQSDRILAGLAVAGGYTKACPQMQWLVELMVSMDRKERRNFLQFVTGTVCLPLGGWRQLSMTVQRVQNSDVLPSSNTCQRHLKLPAYATSEELERKLLLAIAEGQSYFALD
ncbi:Aste57867_1468 [Aphanomyces stellatus]|uniref:Aste57867_1468 protein n=1 Tax=Aphanomyces stellatus TaxID=120398 RepID=A0A485K9G9_9STRA|nr:hypothetical protein As57867_001467 [Aphanomyces stellatus]VFT78684.1 Aste57867_1468 [Aphanomyces stellatus]